VVVGIVGLLGGPAAVPEAVTGVFVRSARTLQNAVEADVVHDQNAHVGLLSRWSKVRTPSEAETHRSPVESGDVSRLLPNDGAMSCGARLSDQ